MSPRMTGKNSKAVNEAMKEAFSELLALTPEELQTRLKAVKIGPIGKLIRDIESEQNL